MSSERRHFESPEEFNTFRDSVWVQYTHTFGEWEFNWVTGMVTESKDSKKIHLTELESDVLRILIANMPKPLTMRQLARQCNKTYSMYISPEDVKVYILRIRNKIGKDRIITSENGYLFVPFLEKS